MPFRAFLHHHPGWFHNNCLLDLLWSRTKKKKRWVIQTIKERRVSLTGPLSSPFTTSTGLIQAWEGAIKSFKSVNTSADEKAIFNVINLFKQEKRGKKKKKESWDLLWAFWWTNEIKNCPVTNLFLQKWLVKRIDR